MYLKFVLKETLPVLKSFVLSIFYLAVENWEYQRISEKLLRTNVGAIRENVTVRYNGGWGVKLLFFCVTYFLNDPVCNTEKYRSSWSEMFYKSICSEKCLENSQEITLQRFFFRTSGWIKIYGIFPVSFPKISRIT